MPLTRLKFANDAGGSGEYELPLNPMSVENWEPGRTLNIIETRIIGGSPVEVDGRDDFQGRIMKWQYRSDMTGVQTMYTTLKGYEFTGSNYKWFNDGSIGSYSGWTKVMVISVSRKVVSKPLKNRVLFELTLILGLD